MEGISRYAVTQLKAIVSRAEAAPDAIAVVDRHGARRTTYAQFVGCANFYARHLAEAHGLVAGDVVVLRLGRCMEHFALRIACAFAGFVFVSVNPDHPHERAGRIVERTGAKLVIDDAVLEQMENARADASAADIPCQLDASLDDSAPYYLVSTSGTTGEPKLILHDRSIFELMDIITHDFGFDTYDVNYAAMADMMFVMSVVEMLFFSSGDTLHIISERMRADIAGLRGYFEREGINSTSTLPALLAAMLPLPNLRSAFVAGEASAIDLTASGTDVLNFYGASEVPGMAYGAASGSGALNRAFTNTRVWLEDEQGAPLSRGTAGLSGEVCFTGPGVMVAYLGDPDATAAHVSQEPGSAYRTYRTGDAAYYDEAGAIVLSGRLDSMVKVRGQRVDVAGVEHVLSGVPGVAECAVVAREAAGETVLAAFYVADKDRPEGPFAGDANGEHPEAARAEEALRTALAEKLPGYAIPAYFVRVDAFARAANGKIDRSVLQLPGAAKLRAPYAAPENEVQRAIAEAFSAEIGVDDVGIDDDFVRLGGDSLKAMRVSAALGGMGLAIPTADILRLRTPRGLERGSVPRSILQANWNAEPSPVPFSAEDALPLTEPQLNVYLDMQAKGKEGAYLIRETMDLPARYSREQVEDALHALCAAHPVLCRTLEERDGTPYLVPGDMPPVEQVGRDAEPVPAPAPLSTLARFALEQAEGHVRLHATFHHLVFDGTSWIVFQRDLLSALEGNALPLDEGYLRAASQASALEQHPKFEEARAFFAGMLAETDEAAPLIPDVGAGRAGRRVRPLSVEASQIGAYCAQAGIGASALFTAAFAYTLSRFTGGSKALFNFLDNGRDACRAHDSLGMFVTTCPLLVDCDADDPRAFVERCALDLYRATAYGFYPYRLLAADHRLDASILFQYRPDLSQGRDTHATWEEDEDFAADALLEAELGFHVAQAGDSYQAELQYSTQYGPETAQRILFAFEAVLKGILDGERLGEIAFASPEDLAFQDAINETAAAIVHHDVLAAFAQQLDARPDATLATYAGKSWTYAEGARIASAITSSLEGAGVNPGDHVAVLVPRSQRYLFCALGVLAAGAAYVPLDDAYPDERLAFMLKDTAARAVLVTADTALRAQSLLASVGSDASLIDADPLQDAALAAVPRPFSYRTPGPDDTACILYTSGTTGAPKGSLITRRAIANFCQWFADSSRLRDGDAYALYASYGFDVHLEMLAPLLVGAEVAVVPEEARLDVPALLEFYVSERISAAHLPVSVARLLRGHALPDGLRILRVGGEAVGDLSLDGACRVLVTYGPTESTVTATCIPAESKVDPSSIGRPLPNVKAYVLDSELRRVPVGAVGQLFLSGYQLAKGYLNRPEETAAAFVPNPFDGEEPGYGRMYATGDMTRILPDGTIGFIGRRDSQVKVRGNRVELSEVEACIRAMECVAGVTVQAIDTGGGKELCAYVVAAGAGMGEDALHRLVTAHVAACKPSYLVPAFVVGLDAIPLNVNGKVDKRALPRPDLSRMKASYRAPESKAERLVARSFEEVLGLERVGLDDDFIRLGGDSIKAIRVVSLLRRERLECQAKDVLQQRTPARIARIAKAALPDHAHEHMQGRIGLLPIQSRFFAQAGGNAFVQTYAVRATERLDAALFERALQVLCDTHDMLRATYEREAEGAVSQIVRPQGESSLTFLQVECAGREDDAHREDGTVSREDGSLDSCAFDGIASTLQEGIAALDIYAGRLGCVALGCGSTCDYVAFAIHHLVIDGASWSILLDDLADIYSSLKAGREPVLPCPYPYGAWVGEVRAYAASMDEGEKTLWRQTRALIEREQAPRSGECVRFDLPLPASFDPQNIYGLSERDFLLCAAARAYKIACGTDAVFDMESHGRDAETADTSRTIGWFTTRYPVHLPQSAGSGALDVARDIIALRKSLAHIPHLGMGFGAMAYISREIEACEAPLTFNYLVDAFAHSSSLFEAAAEMHEGLLRVLDAAASDAASAAGGRRCSGLVLDILKEGDTYRVRGTAAAGTGLHGRLQPFLDAFAAQLSCVADALERMRREGSALYPMRGNATGFYLDEIAHDKQRAFLTSRIASLPEGMNEQDACRIARALVRRHPVLRTRIELGEDGPLGVCDARIEPECAHIATDDDEQRVRECLSAPFDTARSLARFVVIERPGATGAAGSAGAESAAGSPASLSLAICLHHAISDLYSSGLLEQEFYELVDAQEASSDRTAQDLCGAVDEERRDWGFLHTALRESDYRASNDYRLDRAFFAEYLTDAPLLYSVPPQLGCGTAGRVRASIPELSQAQREFAERLGIPAHGLFVAAFAYTLALFSASEKVCFNFTEHGRRSDEEMHAIGMYVRSFPVMVDCADRSVAEFVTQAFASSMAAMQHSAYPLHELIDEFGVGNEVAFENNTVFEALVPEPDDGLAWEALPQGVTGIANFECILLRSARSYVLAVTHTGAYSKECALSFAQTYRAVLADMGAAGDGVAGDGTGDEAGDVNLSHLAHAGGMGERTGSRAPWNAEPTPVPTDIVRVFDEQVAARPHAVCLRDAERSLCYAQADALSDAIARELTRQGVGPQDRAALLTGRNALFSASMIACLKADVTYIPLDEDQPAPRIARMLDIARCTAIVATPATLALAQEVADMAGSRAAEPNSCRILCLDDAFEARALAQPMRFERAVPTRESRNCILFTSGTTGDPKGIVNRRVTQSNLAQAIARIGALEPGDVYGLYASFGYSPHLDSLAAIVAGASIDVVPTELRLDMQALRAYFDEHAVTHTFLSSSIAYRLFHQEKPATLKTVFRGGEPVKDFENTTPCRIFDEFGCTECSNIFQIEAGGKRFENELGRPIDNTHVYLLDVYGRPVPPGAAGRLFVSGEQLAACELAACGHEGGEGADAGGACGAGAAGADGEGRSAAEYREGGAFTANTQESDPPFERMYPTGDIACTAEGRIVHLGRTDGVMKVRGNRVEPGEVEACVRAHDAVADAVVRVMDVQGSRELVAYVVLADTADGAMNEPHALSDMLRAYVAAAKPAFMVPACFVRLDAIPLNAHGKVDTRALPAPDTASLHAPYAAPRDELEQAVVRAFEEVLSETRLGIDDDFLLLGGDSLKAMKAASLLRSRSISGADILRLRTARAVAEGAQPAAAAADAAGTQGEGAGAPPLDDEAAILQRTQDLFSEYLGGFDV